jgi:hypothetical protein
MFFFCSLVLLIKTEPILLLTKACSRPPNVPLAALAPLWAAAEAYVRRRILKSKRMNKVFWLVLIAGAVALNAMQSNLEFAIGFTLPWFLLGLILSPLWWLATKKSRKDPWQWFDWLNAAAYIMVILFLLRFAVHSYMGSSVANAAEPSGANARTELHKKIDEAIVSLASPDYSRRQQAANFLLSAPPVFRSNMENAYMNEAEGIAKSLPQQIDGYTTLQSLFVSSDATYVGYTIHFNKEDVSPEDKKDISDTLREQTVMQICRDGGTVLLSMLFGKDVVRSYSYENGEMFFKTRVSWNDCQKLR